MTTNQTIDGVLVPRELLERLLTDACNENWSDLNELLHSATTCRCKRYGKGNPHWPCPAHPAPAAQPQGATEGIQVGTSLRGQSFIRNCQVTCCGSCPVGRTIGAIK